MRNAYHHFCARENGLDHSVLVIGAPEESFDRLRKREWIMLAPYCADAGTPRAITAAFAGRRRLHVANVRHEAIGSVFIQGRRIGTPADALENGVTAEPTGALELPAALPAGLYFIDNQWAFAVSRPKGTCAVVLPVSTMQAFNDWGGRSAYTERKRQRETGQKTSPHHYSLQRPMARRFATDVLAGFFEWLPRGALAGEDIRFIPDYELARPGALADVKLLLIPGRSEYWTRESREAVDGYIDAGGDLVLLSSETMLHEIRYEKDRLAWWWRGSPANPNSPALPYWYDRARSYPLIPSIGPNPGHGGSYREEGKQHPEWGVYRVYDACSPLAKSCGLEPGGTIALPSTAYYDGLPVRRFKGNTPILDERSLPFHRWTLLAHSFGRGTPLGRIGAWFAFQREVTSGRVVHFGSFAWSTMEGLGGKGPGGKRPAEVVDATVRHLRSGADIFGPRPEPMAVPLSMRVRSFFSRRR